MAIRIQENIPLRELTTLKVGGTARYFVSAATAEALAEAVSFAKEEKVPFVVLGGGSNVLVGDRGIEGLVIKLDILGVDWRDDEEGVLVIAGAGESWDALVAEAACRGLWGVENLSGIPGTVGAAPIQNIGAYGAEIKDILEWVEVLDAGSGEMRQLSNAECGFQYRESIFKRKKGKSFIVTRVALRLSKKRAPNLEYTDLKERFSPSAGAAGIQDARFKKSKLTPVDIRKAVLEIRSRKFPDLKRFGTAGSFFKNPVIPQKQFDELKKRFPDLPGFPLLERFNPESGRGLNLVKVSLAWILDNICGLKGLTKGNVRLFERQPIVLVTTGAVSAEEISLFAKEVAVCVKEKTGIEIEWEVASIGFDRNHLIEKKNPE